MWISHLLSIMQTIIFSMHIGVPKKACFNVAFCAHLLKVSSVWELIKKIRTALLGCSVHMPQTCLEWDLLWSKIYENYVCKGRQARGRWVLKCLQPGVHNGKKSMPSAYLRDSFCDITNGDFSCIIFQRHNIKHNLYIPQYMHIILLGIIHIYVLWIFSRYSYKLK